MMNAIYNNHSIIYIHYTNVVLYIPNIMILQILTSVHIPSDRGTQKGTFPDRKASLDGLDAFVSNPHSFVYNSRKVMKSREEILLA